MDWERAVALRLLAAPAVTAIVGDLVEWNRRSGLYPAIVLETISDPRPQTMDGFDSIRPSRVQANCYAPTKAAASTLREAVIAALIGSGEFSGVWFDRAEIENIRPAGGETVDGYIDGESIDFIFWHKG